MNVDLIGHPFAPIGVGECLRSSFRAMRAVGLTPRLVDVFSLRYGDPALETELGPHLSEDAAGDVQVFFVNGDEVAPVLHHLGARLRPGAHRAIQPMWELESYPAVWARDLERFDEVWAVSAFIRDAIARAVARPVFILPTPVAAEIGSPLGRGWFGIPESAFALLFAFDLRSYAERKNPRAVLEAFRRLRLARPEEDVVLLLKVSGGEERAAELAEFQRAAAAAAEVAAGRVVFLPGRMTDLEIRNLLWCSDCFVSLHRSEGFGRLLAEAMLLGKPVVATGWSGNVDFMTPETACLVPCRMVPVGAGEYPFGEGQRWAEPDVDAAVAHLLRLIDDREYARALGARASRHVRTHLSPRAAGLHYLERLAAIAGGARAKSSADAGAPARRDDAAMY